MDRPTLYSLNTDARTPTWQECCRVRDYLHAASVEFDDRNIRQSNEARRELLALTGDLLVPFVVYGDQRVTGFDPDGLERVARAYRSTLVTAP